MFVKKLNKGNKSSPFILKGGGLKIKTNDIQSHLKYYYYLRYYKCFVIWMPNL